MNVRPYLGATSVDYITSKETRIHYICSVTPTIIQMELTRQRKSITWLRRECFLQGEPMKITALCQKIKKVNNNSNNKKTRVVKQEL